MHRLVCCLLVLPLSFFYAHRILADTIAADLTAEGFMQDMVDRHGFSLPELNALFKQAAFQEEVIAAITTPAESKAWYQYRSIFLTPERIKGGADFLIQHAVTLKKAEEAYGVPAEIIVAILGVETRFGLRTGRFRVIDSLATLALYYPPRASFFRRQLEEFLLLAREEKFDPLNVYGSYAGAIGQAQFIPSSYRRHAVDFDGDQRRDLSTTADAIGSIANYLKTHGWEANSPIAHRATPKDDQALQRVAQGYRPQILASELRKNGLQFVADVADHQRGGFIQLELETGPEYWVTWKNFHAITEYNHSPLYAMAVYQLSQEIRAATSKVAQSP